MTRPRMLPRLLSRPQSRNLDHHRAQFVMMRSRIRSGKRVSKRYQGAAHHPALAAAIAAIRSFFRSRSLADFSWPQAARMSRPRGVRTGEA